MASRGRPPDTFGDPVARLKSWAWASRLYIDTGLEAAADLARLFSTTRASHFRKVQDDGADPQRLQAGEGSLAEAVAACAQGQGAYQDCTHALWDALTRAKVERQPHTDYSDTSELLKKMHAFGIVRMKLEDAFYCMALGLPRSYPTAELPGAADLRLKPQDFASLDGLYVLLQLYRSAIHEGALTFAGVFGQTLEAAVSLYVESRWADDIEIQDTWHWVLHSRMLSWRPYLKPEPLQLAHWRDAWVRLDGEGEELNAASDAPPLPRRDRRKIFVHACAAMFSQELPVHYVHGTDLLCWLTANRDRIREQVFWALDSLRSPGNVATDTQPQALIMPPHIFSTRTRPMGGEIPSAGFRLAKLFELISVREAE